MHMNTRLVLLLFTVLVPGGLFAREKTDVIVMANGDRLTCEIKKLEAGVLYVSLSYVDGTVAIEWAKVARLESHQLFTVNTEGGATYTGTLKTAQVPADQPRSIQVEDEQRGSEAVVEQSTVVAAGQYGDSMWRRFHGNFGFGLTYNNARATTQYNLDSELTYRLERTTLDLTYDSVLTSVTGTQAITRNQVDLTAERLLRWNNWYYAGAIDFLQSSAQGITASTVAGGGLGRYFKRTNSTRISLTGGFAVQDTQYNTKPGQNALAALIAGNIYIFRFKRVDLTVTPVLLPYLTDPGRVRFNLNARYRMQIISNLWWNFSFYGNWDNRPPTGLAGSDYGTSTGISYSFH